MHRMPNTTYAGLLFVILSGLSSSSALADPIPPRGPIPFAAFDQDGNGLISEQEFTTVRGERMAARAAQGSPMYGAANAPDFKAFDSDGDGQLTLAELTAGQQAQMQQRRAMGTGMDRGMAHGMGMGRNMPAFADFDLNGDGKIVAEEFDAARGKRIDERAQQGYMMRNLANAPSFAELDTDGDGSISPEEFSAHQAQRLQQNSP